VIETVVIHQCTRWGEKARFSDFESSLKLNSSQIAFILGEKRDRAATTGLRLNRTMYIPYIIRCSISGWNPFKVGKSTLFEKGQP
jgi:hypothetical protein